jgi:hypothetical protein
MQLINWVKKLLISIIIVIHIHIRHIHVYIDIRVYMIYYISRYDSLTVIKVKYIIKWVKYIIKIS